MLWLWMYIPVLYVFSKYRKQNTYHILFFVYLEGNFHELRKRKTVDYEHLTGLLLTLPTDTFLMRKTSTISTRLLAKSTFHFQKHSWRKKAVEWHKFGLRRRVPGSSHGTTTMRSWANHIFLAFRFSSGWRARFQKFLTALEGIWNLRTQ